MAGGAIEGRTRCNHSAGNGSRRRQPLAVGTMTAEKVAAKTLVMDLMLQCYWPCESPIEPDTLRVSTLATIAPKDIPPTY